MQDAAGQTNDWMVLSAAQEGLLFRFARTSATLAATDPNHASLMASPPDTDTVSRCASCGVPRNFGTTCQYCGTVYPEAARKLHPDQDLPKLHDKYTVTHDGRAVSISVQLRKTVDVVIAVFIGIFAFFVMILFGGLSGFDNSAPSTAVVLFVVKFIVVGGVTLFAVLCWFNRVTIEANTRYLSLRHHPIPLQLSMKIRTEDMTDLSVIARRKTYKDENWDVPVLQVSTITGTRHDLMVGRAEADFGDFDVLHRHLSEALTP